LYRALPADIRALADKNFALLKSDPRHPSLHLKRIDDLSHRKPKGETSGTELTKPLGRTKLLPYRKRGDVLP
jgi:hypothetical protein